VGGSFGISLGCTLLRGGRGGLTVSDGPTLRGGAGVGLTDPLAGAALRVG
jgi:hypothetical protein